MRLLLTVLVAVFGFAGVAQADPFANFYGNTVTVSNPTAGERKVLIDEGGTYTQVTSDGTSASGKWAVDGDNACFTQDAAEAGAAPYCTAATARSVGDSWDMTAPDGTAEKAMLSAGR